MKIFSGLLILTVVLGAFQIASGACLYPQPPNTTCVNNNWVANSSPNWQYTNSGSARSQTGQIPCAPGKNCIVDDKCKTLVTKSIDGSTKCEITPEQDRKLCAVNYTVASSSDNLCSKRYSCESLFSKDFEAQQCNYKRCGNIQGRSEKYCDCKYGKNGTGAMGVPLNTDIPFLGQCLVGDSKGNTANSFPEVIRAFTKILVTAIMLVSFVMILIAGLKRASAGVSENGKSEAIDMIRRVIMGFILLGLMGAILKLINPNFFK